MQTDGAVEAECGRVGGRVELATPLEVDVVDEVGRCEGERRVECGRAVGASQRVVVGVNEKRLDEEHVGAPDEDRLEVREVLELSVQQEKRHERDGDREDLNDPQHQP